MLPESICPRRRGHAGSPALRRLMAGAAVALLLAGCGTAVSAAGSPGPRARGTAASVNPNGPSGAATIARDDANGKTVHVGVGDRLDLILSSDYWSVRGSSAPAVLRQDGPTSRLPRPSTCPAIPGLGCTPEQTSFTALAPGIAVITASRASCGEALRCVGDQGRFRVIVVVQ